MNKITKNFILNRFFLTIFWATLFSIYEWQLNFATNSFREAFLLITTTFNIIIFLLLWIIIEICHYIYLYLRKKTFHESILSYIYLTTLAAISFSAKLFLYIKDNKEFQNSLISVIIFFAILTILMISLYSVLGLINKKTNFFLKFNYSLNTSFKFLSIFMLVLILFYIHIPKLEKFFQSPPGNGNIAKPNIILITLDTLRADHLSCYGYNRKTSPFIDKIANEGILFNECISPSSWTLPSHASIFTGLYPSEHGAIHSALQRNKSKLDKSFTTLAEIMEKNGYLTAGFIGGPYLSSEFGLSQGFEYYNDILIPSDMTFVINKLTFTDILITAFKKFINPRKISEVLEYYISDIANYIYNEHFSKKLLDINGWKKKADEINSVALPWIEKNKDSRFFLFINYFDTHTPYKLPIGFDNLFDRGYKGKLKGLPGELYSISSHAYSPTDDDFKYLISLYDSQICFLDMNIRKLFEKLDSCKINNDTIVIITSDHGESFGEHGLVNHGFSLYDDNIRVPLILWGLDKIGGSRKINTQTSTVDILPTILDITNIPIPNNIHGKSLLRLISDDHGFERPVVLSEIFDDIAVHRFGDEFKRDLKSFRSKEWKYISSSNGKNELYNLINDKKEIDNIIKSENKISDKFEKIKDEFLISLNSVLPGKDTKAEVGNNIKEKLKALGYIN